MNKKQTLFLGLTMLVLVACGEGKWHTHDAWARPTAAGGNAAVYFLLHNATSQDDALLSATTDAAAIVEIHQSGMVDDMDNMVENGAEADHEHEEGEEHEHEGDEEHPMSELEAQDLAAVGTMTALDRVDIPAGHEIQFEPGSYHIMLIGLTQELKAGDHFEVTLHFEHSEDLVIEVHVIAP